MPRITPYPALPPCAWPEGDRRRWIRFLELRSGVKGRFVLPIWKDCTLRGVQASYGRWLAWLQRTEMAELALDPGDRLRPPVVARYFDELQPRLTNVSIATALIHIESVTRILSPGYNGKWLRPIICRLRRDQPSTRGKLERMVSTQELLQLGLNLMETARPLTRAGEHRRMLEFRDGLALALLAVRPLRLANFVALRIGKSLQLRGNTLWIVFEDDETKNRRRLEFPFPSHLRKHYEHYMLVVRPYLALRDGQPSHQAGGNLWLASSGMPLSKNAMYAIVKKRTLAKFGKSINPHLFRDCIATSIANDRADLIWAIPHLLGHWNSFTSESVYTHAQGSPEQTTFRDHVEGLRKALRHRK
jgi:integrase/recombinase XerD